MCRLPWVVQSFWYVTVLFSLRVRAGSGKAFLQQVTHVEQSSLTVEQRWPSRIFYLTQFIVNLSQFLPASEEWRGLRLPLLCRRCPLPTMSVEAAPLLLSGPGCALPPALRYHRLCVTTGCALPPAVRYHRCSSSQVVRTQCGIMGNAADALCQEQFHEF